jgi:HEAT repeat protein
VPPAAALGLLNELQRNARDPVHRAAAFRQSLDIEVGTAAARIAEVHGGEDWLMKQVALESVTHSAAPNIGSTLAGKLSSWDAPTQRAVVAALGRRRESSATDAIVKAAKHSDVEVRAAAVEAIGWLPGTRATAELLAKIAASSDSGDAKTARLALARLSGPDVSGTVLSGARQGEARVRVVYLEQLALRNMTEALPLLHKSRADPNVDVRIAAVAALGEIAPPAEEKALLDWTIEATDSAEQTRALRSLVNIVLRNPDVAGRGRTLFDLLDFAAPELALRLLPALARISGPASAETAARLAIRDDAALADAATRALARWPDATAMAALATVAEKAPRTESRVAAIDGALRYFERNRVAWSAENTPVIERLITSSDDAGPRRKLIALLHRANDEEALALAEKLKADTTLAKEAAVAADVIRANVAGPPKVRASASNGVGNIMDHKTSTRWTTPSLGEEWVEVDFRLSRPIQRLTLDQTGRAAEFPPQYEVYVTDNPKQPGNAIVSGAGQSSKTVVELPDGTRGRYLIVKNVAERKDTPWAICELYVD